MSSRITAWFGLSTLVIALDQWSKFAMRDLLAFGDVLPVTSFFDLVMVLNSGAAFSFLSSASGWQRWFFIVLALGISVWLAVLIVRHAAERLLPLCFALVLGGAIGNVIDRFYYGAVVDFLYVHIGRYGWPAFNVADSAISVGLVLLIWDQLFGQRQQTAAN
ncbi:MAG: signal peptidase II [Rhodocyclaceae bacterium]